MRSKGLAKVQLEKAGKTKRKTGANMITSTFTLSEDEEDDAAFNPLASVIAVREGPDLLGEAALKKNEKRVCDVVAHSYCQCLLLEKEDYESALNTYLVNKQNETKNLLRNIEIVKEWNLVKI